MVGTNKPLPTNDGTYLRKIRKPLIEKKRRERMNQSITQLRALIDDTVKQNVAPMTRVDKADILELTVCHLTKLRHQQPVTMTTDKRMSYAAGFQDCAHHVTSFLAANGLVDSRALAELTRHLHISASRRPNMPLEPGHCRIPMSSTHTSTPVRISQTLPQHSMPIHGHVPNVSPIQQYDLYTRFTSPGHNISAGNSTYDSISTASWKTPPSWSSPRDATSSTTDTRTSSSRDISFTTSSSSGNSSLVDDGSVCIGTGSEDKIGHVIQETTWRPW